LGEPVRGISSASPAAASGAVRAGAEHSGRTAIDEGDSGSSATMTIKKPGTYAYHCEIHNFVKGAIKAS
jgi:plastocyanin